MRSELPDQKVTIKLLRTSKLLSEFSVGTEWKRYTITFNSDKETICDSHVRFRGKGTLYVDAIQLEEGEKASEYEQDPYVIHEDR